MNVDWVSIGIAVASALATAGCTKRRRRRHKAQRARSPHNLPSRRASRAADSFMEAF